ncbi:hypothetical protein IWQ62_003450 [Dispira parvispora]|uniref:Periplasmic binding protein n=1 Tax=Dispira parvispora TaxID=1520584 RepID=A0A9W8E1M7_9FUNG|nr:hypothetical protein IWQ62_003450 [Dispira parvispora]
MARFTFALTVTCWAAVVFWAALPQAYGLCNGDPDSDNFPDKISVPSNSNFTVTYENNFKVITNEVIGEQYVLYCGPSRPSARGNIKSWIQIPVTNVAVLEPAVIPFLELLNVASTIKVVDEAKNITSPCMQSRLEDQSVKSVYDASSSDWETISVAFSRMSSANDSIYIPFSGTNDIFTPLEKMEWIKYLSVFFNAEKKASEAFDRVKSQYQCHQNNVKDVQPSQVAWSDYHRDPETGDESFLTGNTPYLQQLTRDAGAFHVASRDSNTSADKFRNSVKTVDYMVDITQYTGHVLDFETWKSLFGFTSDFASDSNYHFYSNKQVWRPTKRRNTNNNIDWGITPLARPDLLLIDMIMMQYPNYIKDYQRNWLQNIDRDTKGKVVEPEVCEVDPLLENFPECPDDPDLSGSESSSDGLGAGAIVGIVIGAVVALGLAAGLYVFLARRRRRMRLQEFINLRSHHDEPEEREML